MQIFLNALVAILAGMGAGIGTGFAGLSAAVFIAPCLVAFLDVPAYEAVCIALASDVLASAVSAYDYYKSGHIDIKNGKYMLVSVLVFTMVGSYVANLIPQGTLGYVSIIAPLVLGLRFLLVPMQGIGSARVKSDRRKVVESIVFGIGIGFICGFMGTGGGMMLLLVLNVVLGYNLKTAVGTSVFIMAFTALLGSGTHVAVMGYMPDWFLLIICSLSTLVFAHLAAKWANKMEPKKLTRLTGWLLFICCAIMLVCNILDISIA